MVANISFAANDWYSAAGAGATHFSEGATTYHSLSAWGRDSQGISSDPQVTNSNPARPNDSHPRAGSPCIGAGANLTAEAWDPYGMCAAGMPIGASAKDFFGLPVPTPHGRDIGAVVFVAVGRLGAHCVLGPTWEDQLLYAGQMSGRKPGAVVAV